MTGSSQAHSQLVRDIQLACSNGDCRLFINNTGKWRDAKGYWTHYGLCAGSSDLIGWRCYRDAVINADADGRGDYIGNFLRFVSLEVKTGDARASKSQQAFINAVNNAGGIAAVVRSVEDAKKVLSIP